MESQGRSNLPPINTAPFDAGEFFRSLGADPESAYKQIQDQVPVHGPATPRAQALIDAGEWDAGDKVGIVCLRDDRCSGIVGQGSGPNAPVRFCGRKQAECAYYSHKTLSWKDFKTGWYIPAGSAAKHGFFQDPRLPLRGEGGPIDAGIARALSQPQNPFKLTVGQWKFVFESWWDAKVIELSDSQTEGQTPSSGITDFETPRAGQVPDEGGLVDLELDSVGPAGASELEDLSSDNEDEGVSAPEQMTAPGDSSGALLEVQEMLDGLRDQLGDVAQELDDVKVALSDERKEHVRTRSAVNKLRNQARAQPQATSTAPSSQLVRQLTARIHTLEAQANQVLANVRALTVATSQLEDVVSAPGGTVQGIVESVERLERQLSVGGGVEAHGASFSTPSDIPGWLASTPNALGLFHDAVTVLHCIGAASVTHKSILTLMKAQKDASIKSELEARVITSFKTKLPAILYGSATTTDDEYMELSSKLKTYHQWHSEDGNSGISQKILAIGGIHEVRRRVGEMAKVSTQLAPILRLSDGLMSDSVHFIQRFVLFIDNWVRDLRDGTFFSEAQVWDIMVTTIETVFDELRAARAPMQDVADTDRSMLLWGILKAHEVMKRFLKHDFINDPVISGILIQKMIRQSPAATSGARIGSLEKNRTKAVGRAGVLIASDGGWMWLLACLQTGFQRCTLLPLTPEALQDYNSLKTKIALDGNVTVATLGELRQEGKGDTFDFAMVDAKITDWVEPMVASRWKRIIWMGDRSTMKEVKRFASPQRILVFKAKHSHMGGATAARSWIAWWGEGADKIRIGGQDTFPTRPHGDWVNPAANIWTGMCRYSSNSNKRELFWKAPDQKPFPWPFPQGPVMISAPSVFLRGQLSDRLITSKEKAALLDLPSIWTSKVIEEIWAWNEGYILPLRMFVETLMAMLDWLDAPEGQSGSGCTGCTLAVPEMDATSQRSHSLVQAKVAHRIGDSTMFRLSHFSWVWEPDQRDKVTTATKGDDAKVDTSLWSVGGPEAAEARGLIQRLLHRWWRKKLLKEAVAEMEKAKRNGNWEDVSDAVRDCVGRGANSSWFEWSDGSRLMYWRWPECWQDEARLGSKAYHTSFPPKDRVGRSVVRDSPEQTKLLAEKLKKLIGRRYIIPADPGELWCVIPYFAVPKGTDDIRVVWSDTENGVNPSIYSPSFFMPLPDTLFRRIGDSTFLGDLDVGEMFHNFPLHPSEQAFAGIRLDEELQQELGCGQYFKWSRLPFGWRPSPYFSITMLSRAVETSIGDRSNPENPFWFTDVEKNLPGMKTYDPGQPWIRRVRGDGLDACDAIHFVDDGRTLGPNEDLATKATRQVAGGLQHKGIQDASRKRRVVSRRPGAWAGTVVFTDQGTPRKFVTQGKWDKTKRILENLHGMLEKGSAMPTRDLMSFRGFLVHVSMTYHFIRPYLKGLHLTIDSWRDNRGKDGWPCSEAQEMKESVEDAELEGMLYYLEEKGQTFDEIGRITTEEIPAKAGETQKRDPKDIPEWVHPVPRLRSDVEAMKEFFAEDKPAMVVLRPVLGLENFAYGFVDASGSGFGGTWRSSWTETQARHGFWCSEVGEESSNYREFRNLVEHVQAKVDSGDLVGKEVWIYTDNAVTENAIYKGTSKSRKLFELVLRLRRLEIDGSFVLRVVHVAGTRMIGEGTDGLSRGEVNPEALLNATLGTVPLHRTPLERSPRLVKWLADWVDSGYQVATPIDWFGKAQQNMFDNPNSTKPETWIWDLPPAGAVHALEELALGRVKRHNVLRGVVLIPNLMRPMWFRRFVRVVDCYFTIPAGCPCWAAGEHEGLTVGLFLPLLRHSPWDWKKVGFLVATCRKVQSLHKEDYGQGWNLLRELWRAFIWISTMPERLVCRLLSDRHHGPLLGVARKRSRNGRGSCG